MRVAIAAVLVLTATSADAETHAKSTSLVLARGKTKPARLLAKKIEVDVVRTVTPCALRVVVEPQHPLFKRFSIDVGYQVGAGGAVKGGRSATIAEVVAVGAASPIPTKRGHVEVTPRKAHDFDVKLDATFDHGSSAWTLSGTVRIEDAACLWDTH
jgi:hypothetical protein